MKKLMNRSNLITKLSNRLNHIPKQDILDSTAILLDKITEALGQGDRVEIRGFGSLKKKINKAKFVRNPKTNEKFYKEKTYKIHFKIGKILHKKINSEK